MIRKRTGTLIAVLAVAVLALVVAAPALAVTHHTIQLRATRIGVPEGGHTVLKGTIAPALLKRDTVRVWMSADGGATFTLLKAQTLKVDATAFSADFTAPMAKENVWFKATLGKTVSNLVEIDIGGASR
jgi:hypothetical protein